MNSFLNTLFTAYLQSADAHISDLSYTEHRRKATEFEQKLKCELSSTQVEQLDCLIDALTSAAYAETKSAFIEGFKQGARCILEIKER